MAPDTDRFAPAVRNPHDWIGVRALLRGCWAIVTVAVGGLGLVSTPLRQIVEARIDIHVLFVLMLCALVIARYQACAEQSSLVAPIAIRQLSRHLSRIVYLVLYGAIGFKELNALAIGLAHGGAWDFRLLDGNLRGGPQTAIFNLQDDWHAFLAAGLFALLLVRALALVEWWRKNHRDAASRAAAGERVQVRVSAP